MGNFNNVFRMSYKVLLLSLFLVTIDDHHQLSFNVT